MNDTDTSVDTAVEIAERFPSLERARGIVVADGAGVRVNVRNGQLHISDGIGRFRRERIFSRVDPPNRVVVVGNAGSISFESIRWLHAVGAGFLHLDRDGQPLVVSINEGRNDARIRRSQAMAASNDIGLQVTKFLLGLKIQGQRDVARRLTADASALEVLDVWVEAVQAATTLNALRQLEASVANLYWATWTSITPRFVTKDESRIPLHWRKFTTRRSLVSKTPRLASDPINATLNFLYGIAENEARLACNAVGCDPHLGIVHMDAPNRASFALDVLEAIRPQIDAFVLDLLARPIRLRDFYETREGICRVLPPLSHHLAGTMPQWALALAPVAERVAEIFVAGTGAKIARLSTPLTQTNRRKARAPERARADVPPMAQRILPPNVCHTCGLILTSRDRSFCDGCLPARKEQLVADMVKRSVGTLTGRKRSDASRTKQSQTMRKRNAQNLKWNVTHPGASDPEIFIREILPGLRRLSVRTIMRATQLSSLYSSQIRRGRVPARRHWEALREISTERPDGKR